MSDISSLPGDVADVGTPSSLVSIDSKQENGGDI